jgi:N-acetylglutamate synthase-like GNAT family acetyltransferase
MKEPAQTQWKIRKARKSDADGIVRFLETQRRPRRSALKVSEYFIAESLGKIVGCIAARKRAQRGYLYGLAVEKSHRRRGIGHALTTCGLNRLRREGVDVVFTLVMFWNIRFIKQHGFELVDKKGKVQLKDLHSDFVDDWAVRSALFVASGSGS